MKTLPEARIPGMADPRNVVQNETSRVAWLKREVTEIGVLLDVEARLRLRCPLPPAPVQLKNVLSSSQQAFESILPYPQELMVRKGIKGDMNSSLEFSDPSHCSTNIE